MKNRSENKREVATRLVTTSQGGVGCCWVKSKIPDSAELKNSLVQKTAIHESFK